MERLWPIYFRACDLPPDIYAHAAPQQLTSAANLLTFGVNAEERVTARPGTSKPITVEELRNATLAMIAGKFGERPFDAVNGAGGQAERPDEAWPSFLGERGQARPGKGAILRLRSCPP